MTVQRLLELYPALADIERSELESVLATLAQWVQAPAGTVLFEEGNPCQGFPMVLSGAVRVSRGSPGGRSLELYRVTPGEVCVVSTACLFGQQPLTAHGEATEPTELLLLSGPGFVRWAEQPAFRRFVFGVFGDRMADLMALVDAVAFQRLDRRLAAALLGHGPARQVTHQALADELGTVREMVTRLLKRFEASGWVDLGRERIEVRDGAALRAFAAGDTAPPSPPL